MNVSSEQERQRLWIGGMIAVVLLFVGVVVLPLRDRIGRSAKSLVARQHELEQVRALAGQLAALPQQGGATTTETPTQVVDRCLATLNLTDRVSSRRPFGTQGQGLELKLDDLPGASVSQLLAALRDGGVNPTALELTDVKAQGTWSLRLTIGSSGEGS
jgi:type II secretory pathway component PulM